ncbi:SMODS domain-containing nucleotidyltransferase [Aureimonas phyllosphaerae]|uniref:SMODS domain-containing nucleotidyltransferase n=1 Tax=Aureimonas phyllosphaerae TaxID=1166078 RepID=UPI003A5C0192
MNIQTGVPRPSTQAEDFLEDLVEDLQVPVSRIEQAERSYKSLGGWLHRPNSTVRDLDPNVYVQGSFRLGTTIKPLNDQEEYDIDSVCEFGRVGKGSLSQAELKRRLGVEVEAYRRSQNMTKPMREGRRCWVLDYADGAQFHMDIVPAVPNGRDTRLILEARRMDPRWAATAIGITDNEVWNYMIVSDDWPRSNPKGYADWFRSRMAVAFARRKQRLAESARASVEDIPDYKVRTPLQAAVMLLKRHRDMMFVDRYSDRPISVIVTTLAAHAYAGEETIAGALLSILSRMEAYVGRTNDGWLIPNPADPLENFADKWGKHPERARAFFEWLGAARRDFGQAAVLLERKTIADQLAGSIGHGAAHRAEARRSLDAPRPGLLRTAIVPPAAASATPSFGSQARVPTKPRGYA